MSKELEALETIRKALEIAYPLMCEEENEMSEYIEIIKTALSQAQKDKMELEELQTVLDDFGIFNIMNLIDTLKNIQFLETQHIIDSKKLKALEIIIKKDVDIHNFKEILIKQDWTYEQYIDEESDPNTNGHQFAHKLLTQEEFDLLKEVLL